MIELKHPDGQPEESKLVVHLNRLSNERLPKDLVWEVVQSGGTRWMRQTAWVVHLTVEVVD